MDRRLKNIVDNFDQMKIGIDEPFKFHCTMCGKCCINREDILLNPRDIYNIAKELKITPVEFFTTYCETYLGDNSRFPIVRLRPRGSIKRCPLMKDRKCTVHKVKPTVCALFPIGRCIQFDEKKKKYLTNDITYIFTDPDCGDDSEIHTVRDWLNEFGIPVDDDYFIKWNNILMKFSTTFRKSEKRVSEDLMEKIWRLTFCKLYLEYDIAQDFIPQFKKNSASLSTLAQLLEKDGK